MKNQLVLKDIGRRIREIRKARNMTQAELADRMGVSSQTISYVESGKKAIRPENLKNLAAALGVSADYLLTGDISDKDLRRIRDRISRLNVKQLDHLGKIVDSIIAMCFDCN